MSWELFWQLYAVIGVAWAGHRLFGFLRHVRQSKTWGAEVPDFIPDWLFNLGAAVILLSAIVVLATLWPALMLKRLLKVD